MKRFVLAVALLSMSGMVSAADQCPAIGQCGYTSSMEYLIKDKAGKVIDRVVWEQYQGTSWMNAYHMKYSTLSHIFSARANETEPALFTDLQRVMSK